MAAAEDTRWIERAQAGDHDAFAALVEKYFRAAYASAYAVLGNQADAEECAQETFVQVHEKLARLRDAGAFGGWVWRIARDVALKHIRKHGRMTRMAEVPDVESAPDEGGLAALTGHEERNALLAALSRLGPEMREALLMKFWEELDYTQMAERTGVSEATLYQRVCRGLKRLRELMDHDAG